MFVAQLHLTVSHDCVSVVDSRCDRALIQIAIVGIVQSVKLFSVF
jgi:hypothetical protein